MNSWLYRFNLIKRPSPQRGDNSQEFSTAPWKTNRRIPSYPKSSFTSVTRNPTLLEHSFYPESNSRMPLHFPQSDLISNTSVYPQCIHSAFHNQQNILEPKTLSRIFFFTLWFSLLLWAKLCTPNPIHMLKC